MPNNFTPNVPEIGWPLRGDHVELVNGSGTVCGYVWYDEVGWCIQLEIHEPPLSNGDKTYEFIPMSSVTARKTSR